MSVSDEVENMRTSPGAREDLKALETRLRTLLPDLYQDSNDVEPVSMGSAGLKYGPDGKVAWNDMWQTFCDLAMAGGPPHKGTLLEPGTLADISAEPDRYNDVVGELCRGVRIVTGLPVHPSPVPGWIRVSCVSEGMSGWLLRAIVMENVSVRAHGAALDLPAGPHYRLEKEIKNVITVIAKTSHYLIDHMTPARHRKIAALFASMASDLPLIAPEDDALRRDLDNEAARMADAIRIRTGLKSTEATYASWLGVNCPAVPSAIWMMRALVATNVLSRREGTQLFLPVSASRDAADATVQRFARIHALAQQRGRL